jgi:proteasome lid subunit RPN8/RPN11
VLPILGGVYLRRLGPEQLNKLYGQLLDSGLSRSTVEHVHVAVGRALRDALRWGRVARNVAILADPPHAEDREMAVWSAAQVRPFLARVDGDRLEAAWWLFATTGMRRGEVVGLRWDNVDLDAGAVLIAEARVVTRGVAYTSQPKTEKGHPRSERVVFADDKALRDQICSFSVRVAPSVLAEVRRHINHAARAQPGAETGGVLFGEIDRTAGVVWVTDAIGPPTDSHASAEGFVCGTRGVARKAERFNQLRRGSSLPVGMWHTHPDGPAFPSPTDVSGMEELVTDDTWPLPQQLLLIFGESEIGAFVFDRDRPVRVVRVVVADAATRRPARRSRRRARR